MTVTINVNGLSLVHRGSGAVSRATLPDVCVSPDAGPVPYENASFSRDLAGGTRSIRVDGGNAAAVDGSRFATSTGDEPGSLGGVASGTVARESTWLTSSIDVRLEGRPACRLTDKQLQNAGNTVDCAGTVQSPVTVDRNEVRFSPLHSKYTGPYALEVKVVLVEGKKKHKVSNARIAIVARDRERDREDQEEPFDPDAIEKHDRLPGRTWEGDTKAGNTRGGKRGQCTFQRLDKRRFDVEVTHPCYAQDAKDHKHVLVDGKPKRLTTHVLAGHLRTEAHKKGVRIGARLDSFAGREAMTAVDELDEVIEGTFFASQCGDVAYHGDYDWRFKSDEDLGRSRAENAGKWHLINGGLSDLSRLPDVVTKNDDGTETRTPSFAEEPVFTGNPAAIGAFVAGKPLTIQSTPLIWPSPKNTPAWPAGTVKAPGGGYLDRRIPALVAAGVPAKKAEQQAVREVMECFIVRTMHARMSVPNGELVAGKPAPAVRSYVVANEILNMRFRGFQENAAADDDYPRQHPFWKRFGIWDVRDTYRDTHESHEDVYQNVLFAFEKAHQVDPGAHLILNDYNVEYVPRKWSRAQLEKATDGVVARAAKKRREKVEPLAEALTEARRKVRERWAKVADDKRPAAASGAVSAYVDALVAADQELDTKMIGADSAFTTATKKALDDTNGDPGLEPVYVAKIAGAEAAYKASLDGAIGTYAQKLGAADALFAQKRAEEAATPKPPADAVVNPSKEAQAAFSKKRHAAALARFASLHVHERRFANGAHAAAVAYGKTRYSAVARRDKHIARWQKPDLFHELVVWLKKHLSPGARSKLVIGFQMHYPENDVEKGYTPDAIAACMRRYAKLDLPVCVTELDVTIEGLDYVVNQRKVDAYARALARFKKAKKAWDKAPVASRGAEPKVPDVVRPVTLAESHAASIAGAMIAAGPAFDAAPAPADETPEQRAARRVASLDKAHAAAEKAFHKKYAERFDAAFREQAQRARRLTEALLSSRNLISLNTWGLVDAPGGFRYMGYPFHWAFPCPTGADCKMHHVPDRLDRKSMYAAMVAAFMASKKQYSDAEIRAGKAKAWAKKIEKAAARSTSKKKR